MSNVYAAPGATFSAGDTDVATTTRLFSINGRIGRLRWFGYMLSAWLLASLALGIFVGLVSLASSEVASRLVIPLNFCVWIFPIIVSRRRMHDIGMSPLFLLGLLIPFINLYFFFILIFKRGDDGANEYGPAPAPNDRAVYLMLSIIPATMIIGILAAVAIPAYKGYTDKARAKAVPVSAPAQQ